MGYRITAFIFLAAVLLGLVGCSNSASEPAATPPSTETGSTTPPAETGEPAAKGDELSVNPDAGKPIQPGTKAGGQ